MTDSVTPDSFGKAYLQDAIRRFRRLKATTDKAVAQVDDQAFFAILSPEGNSIALILKHLGGNLRSRWRDFLTTDGEKPDRHRDTEFEIDEQDTREAIMARWQAGWQYLMDALEPLDAHDVSRTIYIRKEPHSVVQAINRQISHYAYHIGQIVFLAKHFQSAEWQWLSIPPGQSEQFNAKMRRASQG